MIPSTIPHGRTARRLQWTFLPPHVRRLVERHCGSPVADAVSQGAGFTPGFASVLTCEDGTRHFVKAASTKAQRAFAHAYREEARKLHALPEGVPAPRLLWSHDADDWVVLGFEYVESRQPRRPWRTVDLEATLDMLERVAELLTPTPADVTSDEFTSDFEEFPRYWEHVRAAHPDLSHAEEAETLASRFAEVCDGDTLVHTDVRDDNLLIRPDGTALLCDWNFPCRGAAWLDTVFLMIGPRGDGIDVDAVLASRPLTRDVPREEVDIVLALLAGYFLRQADEPVPTTSPHLREAQRWQGEVVFGWLAERRGWVDLGG